MECMRCGCSDLRACVDGNTGERCSWVEPGLCSFCEEEVAVLAQTIWEMHRFVEESSVAF